MSAGRGETGVLIESVASAHLAAVGKAVAVMVPDYLVGRWERAYGEYRDASELVNASTPGDSAAAERMALASQAVASAWRDMAVESDLAWWAAAAVTTAAQAFDHQSQDWTARARHGRQSVASGDARKRRPVYPVAVRHEGGVADAG